MRRTKAATCNRWLIRLLALALLIGLAVAPALAEQSSLTPDPLVYENGNITLSKNAVQIGADEWEVTVEATIGEVPVEKRKIEVVFVLDISGSMDATAHTHSDECRKLECGKSEHQHEGDCFDLDNLKCGKTEHEHSDACKKITCEKTEHEHTGYTGNCYEECTQETNGSHWKRSGNSQNYKHNSNECESSNGRYYYLVCDEEEHTHINSCFILNCGKETHEHTEECADLICTEEAHTHSSECYGGEYACGFTDTTRFGVAARVAERLIANLPEGTDITRLAYDRDFYDGISNYFDLETGSGTNTWTAITKALSNGYFSQDESKKILVLLNDGAADDSSGTAKELLAEFKDPEGTDGMVFTVGFAYDGEMLAEIAGNGGYYMYAENASDLTVAFDKLEQTLTAMLEDPMGAAVGFDKTTIYEMQTSGGVISSNENTIYWNPAEDGSDTVRNSTIKYSYKVKLNEQADYSSGSHTVKLNNPTYFRYGFKEGASEPTQMKEAQFPIPEATYAVSTMQTKWQADGTDIQTPLEVEARISNYASASYIPTFEQDYRTITPIIPIENSNDYYRYIGTTVTADGTEIPGVDAVDASQAVAYVVVHRYERVNSHELTLGGTKTLVGRDFMQGDSFTFTITAVTPGAPMPANNTVPITPTSGTSVAFAFDTISFQEAGKEYTYTIQELEGSQQGVIYDTTKHTLVVKTEEINKEIVVSYTLDGVENGLLTVRNQLDTGSLKIEKRSVTSHLPEHQEKLFGFLVSAKDMSGRPINGEMEMRLDGGEAQPISFTNGYAALKLKAGQSVVIDGLPDGAAYTVTEDAAGGFTPTSSGDTGVIAANTQQTAVFDNVYQSSGLYQFLATKKLEGGTLELDQFTFSVLDETGQVVSEGKNNTDGSVFLNTLHFTPEDIGTKTYTVIENPGTEPGVLYDRTRYSVTLTIADRGDGVLTVTDDLEGAPIVFTNKVIENQFVVSKTVAGSIGSRNKDFTFTIVLEDMAGKTISVSRDNGDTFESVTLNQMGEMSFTLRHDQAMIFFPVSGKYTVTESDAGGYTTAYSINQAEAVTGVTATGELDADGGHVAFTNTLDIPPPTGVHDSVSCALAGLMLAAVLISILRMGGGCARHE